MYKKQFNLNKLPFSPLPDTSFLVSLPQHSNALKRLEFSLESSEGLSLLTGETGCGKTLLLRSLQEQLGSSILSGYIADTARLEGNILERILLSLGIESDSSGWSSNYQLLTDYLITVYAEGKQVVIFFDEAQNLSLSSLEELRVLTNINSGNNHLLHIVLAGSPELRSALAKPSYQKLSQRIDNSYHLTPLSKEETTHYIYKRLVIAGAHTENIFTTEACELIYEISGGIPRLINQLCHTSLVYAYGMNIPKVSEAVVKVVLTDRVRSWATSDTDIQEPHSDDSTYETINTKIEGWFFRKISPEFKDHFPQTNSAAPHKSSWLTVIDPEDRDRVSKVFKHYLALGNHHFELSTSVSQIDQRNNACEKPARLIFDKKDDTVNHFTLSVQLREKISRSI